MKTDGPLEVPELTRKSVVTPLNTCPEGTGTLTTRGIFVTAPVVGSTEYKVDTDVFASDTQKGLVELWDTPQGFFSCESCNAAIPAISETRFVCW
ncbi:MAG: hypothetical protein WBW33_31510 [Bryobacteraceae bacterium]